MTRLTDKREKYVQELIKGRSQREAYRIAFPSSVKWTDAAVDTQASILFADSKVIERYNELHDRLIKEAEDECIITTKEVLKELVDIAKDDIGNYLRFYTDEDGTVRTEIKDSTTIPSTKNICEVSQGKGGTFKFKTYCRDEALIQIGRILGMYTEKVETKNLNINDDVSAMSEEELTAELSKMGFKKE
jgi:phage terminase small subunit